VSQQQRSDRVRKTEKDSSGPPTGVDLSIEGSGGSCVWAVDPVAPPGRETSRDPYDY